MIDHRWPQNKLLLTLLQNGHNLSLISYQKSTGKDLTPQGNHTDMITELGDRTPNLSTKEKWETGFRRGRSWRWTMICTSWNYHHRGNH